MCRREPGCFARCVARLREFSHHTCDDPGDLGGGCLRGRTAAPADMAPAARPGVAIIPHVQRTGRLPKWNPEWTDLLTPSDEHIGGAPDRVHRRRGRNDPLWDWSCRRSHRGSDRTLVGVACLTAHRRLTPAPRYRPRRSAPPRRHRIGISRTDGFRSLSESTKESEAPCTWTVSVHVHGAHINCRDYPASCPSLPAIVFVRQYLEARNPQARTTTG